MIKLDATKNILKVRALEPLTSNAVNVNQVQFSFNSAWDGLSKTAVFRAGSTSVSVLLSGDSCAIPWEVLQKAGVRVEAGVYGTQGEEIVLPTIWSDIGEVQEGTKPGESGQEPTPDVYAQLLQAFPAGGTTGQVLAKASNADRDVKWVNQSGGGGGTGGADGKDGGYYTPSVTQPDENTMQVAYTASDPAMPSVSPVNVNLPAGPQGPQGEAGPQGPQGVSGVYVGSGDMPEGYNVQIDPDGTPSDIIPPEPTYELITDTEIIEDGVAAFNLSNLSLDKMAVYVYSPANATAFSWNVEFYKASGLVGYVFLGNLTNTGERWANVVAKNENGIGIIEHTAVGSSTINQSVALSRCPRYIDGTTPFTKFGIYLPSGSTFPVGAKIQIWGISSNG